MQYAHTMHNQRNFTPLQAPAQPPFPINLSAAQGMRTSSNPERGQNQPLGGLHRHDGYLPMPPGQSPVPQNQIPLQRLTSSTQVLEHIHPGSANRGDFKSDSTAHQAMDTYYSGPPNEHVAMPSRCLSGPLIYQRLTPPTHPFPSRNRGGTFDSNLPRGKKNPKKRSSDDARMVSNTGNAPCQASNGADPKQPFAQPNHLQMPFYPQSPDAISFVQASHPSSGAVQFSNNFHTPNLPPSHHSDNGQEPFHHLLYDRQAPTQAPMEGRSRVVSNLHRAPAHEIQGATQDLRPAVLTIPIPGNAQHQGAPMDGQFAEGNASLVSTQVRQRISQPLDPQAFGHQLPDHRTDAGDRQNMFSENQRAALAPMSNVGQPQYLGTPKRSGVDEVPRRPVQEGCKIWVGGLPNAIDKTAVLALLRPCRGLVNVSEPRVSQQIRNSVNRAYAFAEYVSPISKIARSTNLEKHRFRNPFDAAEALERLPQTRFAIMPEGSYLKTNYPIPKQYQSPGHYRHGDDGDSKRTASNISPTKPRRGEDSDRMMKSKNEHGRKPSKGSSRGKKPSTSSSEGKTLKPPEPISAVDGGQKELGVQPEEAVVITGPHDTAGSKSHASQSSTDSQGLQQTSQDLGVIQPDVGVETHAKQVSGSTNDGAQDVSSAFCAKPQVQETYRATSLKHTEGHTKGSKKKSKGSNKLPIPENKGSEPPTVQPAPGSANPKAPPKPFASDVGKFLEDSGHLEGKEKHAGFETEASKSKAPAVPLGPTPTLSKDLGIADQSFLGRDPTETDGVRPEASVAHVTKPSDAREDEAEMPGTVPALVESALSAAPLEHPDEPLSQPMRRDTSNSTQGSADTASSVSSSTAPPSISQTECSNSSTQRTSSPMVQAACPSLETALSPDFSEPGQFREKLEASVVSSNASQAGSSVISKRDFNKYGLSQEATSEVETSIRDAEPGETAMERGSKSPTALAPSVAEKGTEPAQKDLQDPVDDEFVGSHHLGQVEEVSEQNSNMSLIKPSISNCDRAILKSPTRKSAPPIPPRSSSLAAPSTPIKTHQRKKPRNLTPVHEASPSRVTSCSVESTKMDSSLKSTEATKSVPSVLSIDTAAPTLTTDRSKDLPKPETPFLMDDGVRVAPPKISRQIVEASNADRYYAQKLDYQVSHLGNAMQINAAFTNLESSDSASTQSSETSTADYALAKEHNDLETTMREAGYRSLSDTSPFTIKDPELAFLQMIDEEGNLLENRDKKDKHVLSWIDDKGKIGPSMTFDAWKKQNEMIEVVKKATAAKRLMASPPPLSWTKVKSHRQQLLRFITQSRSRAIDQQNTPTEAPQILEAYALLDKIPQRDSSIVEMQKWSRKVSQFLEENASELSSAYAQSRKPTTNSPSESSRGTHSRRQQQERRRPAHVDEPEPQFLTCELARGEDAFGANAKLSNPLTSGQTTESENSPSTLGRRTPSEERPMPSVALIPSSDLSPVTKLQDLFSEMGKERRSWSDDRHGVRNSQEEMRMTVSNPELNDLGRDLDPQRVTEVKDVEPEQGVRETEHEVHQGPDHGTQSQSMGKELGSEGGEQDRRIIPKSDKTKDPLSAESDEKAIKNPEDAIQQKQTSQLLGVSFSSFDSNYTTSNEGDSEEAQHKRPRGGHSPLKRSGYNAVAGRGTEGTRGGRKQGSKDPWALPQGEKPWCTGGRGEKKKRERK